MMADLQRQTVALNELDWSDDRFRMSYFRDESHLRSSIGRVGLLHLPLVQVEENGRYRIVSGWRRLMAIRELGWTEVKCSVLPRSADMLEWYRRVLEENLSVRELNLVEKAHVLGCLRGVFRLPEDVVRTEYLPLLGFGRDPLWVARLEKVLEMAPLAQKALAEDRLSWEMIDFLAKLPRADQEAFVDAVLQLGMGKNRQREAALLLSDLSRRIEQSVAEILSGEECRRIVGKQQPAGARQSEFFAWLRRRRYPLFSRLEDAFRQWVRELHLPPNVQIEHSPYFESARGQVVIRFRSAEECEKGVRALAERAASGQLRRLEEFLNPKLQEQI
jgi:ParB family chromosome partitioning protein